MPMNAGKSALRYLAEALIAAPALALVVVWVGVILLGLAHVIDPQARGQQISQLLLVLSAAGFVCILVGVLLFAIDASLRRR